MTLTELEMSDVLKSRSSLQLEDDYFVMVAAIDFGTTFSGYAFSFKSEPTSIRMNKSWGGNLGFESYKTPTCILTDDEDKFVAFGYEAEDQYSEMMLDDDDDDEDDKKYHLYRNFKMMLHNEGKLSKSSKISSVDGRISLALDIFAMALKYLKDHLIATIKNQEERLDESLIKWVLTVPAIWREEAKQFMREAAYQAGLIQDKDCKKLVICLEPEAASIMCRNKELSHFQDDVGDVAFKAGTKYMVVDAGGGTVDITVHEVLVTGNIKELHHATGGAWGGTKVDDQFIQLVKDVLGNQFVSDLQEQCPKQWFRFLIKFEKVKRSVKPDGKSKMSLDLPWALCDFYIKQNQGKSIQEAIKEKSHLNVAFAQGMLVLKPAAVEGLFKQTIDNIVSHLQELLQLPKIGECKFCLLVGGFGESVFLQKAVKNLLEERLTVLVPSDAQIAVIKGAVGYGQKPKNVEFRVARSTYGLALYSDILKNTAFKVCVRKGDEIEIGQVISFDVWATSADQLSGTAEILRADKVDPKYLKEEGVQILGNVVVDMPDTRGGKDRRVSVNLTFGGAEIEVNAIDQTSGKTTKAVVDFLSQ